MTNSQLTSCNESAERYFRVYVANKRNKRQLKDVYGDSVDKIIQGNVSDIIFIKSIDEDLLQTLEKLSGTTHRSYVDGKNVSRDLEKIFMKNQGMLSYSKSTVEEPVIRYNDLMLLPPKNNIVFRAGDNPIWNRGGNIMPMAYRLHRNQIKHPGHEYNLQTIPSTSTAKDFDVRRNQPDFSRMLEKRIRQALSVKNIVESYKQYHNYTDYDIEKLDPDDYSTAIMELISIESDGGNVDISGESVYDMEEDMREYEENKGKRLMDESEINKDQLDIISKLEKEYAEETNKIYANGLVSRGDVYNRKTNVANHQLDSALANAYHNCKFKMQKDKNYFTSDENGNLKGLDGTLYIKRNSQEDIDKMNALMKDADSRVYGSEDIRHDEIAVEGLYTITDAFCKFLVSLDSWQDICNGDFEKEVIKQLKS